MYGNISKKKRLKCFEFGGIKAFAKKEWSKIARSACRDLVRNYDTRLNALIQNKG